MSKRKIKILITSLIIVCTFFAAAWALWGDSEEQKYIPGQSVEGLTSRLDRDVPDDYNPVTFQDVTAESGIDFWHFNYDRTSQLPEDMGSGVAWFDYNNDGWDDLFLVNYSAPLGKKISTELPSSDRCKLYRNNGNGTFTDVSKRAGADLAIRGMGVAVGDYNNDGWADLFLTTYGKNILLKNTGKGTFINKTTKSGLGDKKGFWGGASWADYDKDGDLDLYVTGYVKYIDFQLPDDKLAAEEPPSINPSSFEPERNLLYRNNGNGTFTEIAQQAGVMNAAGRSLSASWLDVNNDSWPDLYVANDVSDNVLYINGRDGTFADFSHSAHVADYRGAMGIGSGDWDNDSDTDIFVTHWIAQENALYTNRWRDTLKNESGSIQFRDDSALHGLGQSSLDYVGWATSFSDMDLDGRLDLFIVNGSTFQDTQNPVQLKPMQDQIYWNGGTDRGFFEVTSLSVNYFSRNYIGRGGAVSDYDKDGDPDIFILNHGGPGVLLKNDQDLQNNWLSVRIKPQAGGPIRTGAKIRIISGNNKQIRYVKSQSSYLSQNSAVQTFGIGKLQTVDTLEIRWPNGQQLIKTNISPNQQIVVTAPSTKLNQ